MSKTKMFLEKILKESDEVSYCDDVNCELVKEDDDLGSDPKFYEYVKSLLDVGAIDDPKYVESLNSEDFDALVKSWMKDPNIINDYKTYVLEESNIPEDPIKNDVKNDLGIEPGSDEEQMLDNIYNEAEEEQPEQEEPVNDFEQLSPEVQNKLNDMASSNSMYKWVIDDVMDSDISGYNGDTFDEKLKSRLNEIIEHGCQSGTVGSLIYYTDTVKFFDNFNDEIYDMVEDVFGAESVLDMLKQHCDTTDIIMGADTVKNYLAWMAYETACSDILDIIESM